MKKNQPAKQRQGVKWVNSMLQANPLSLVLSAGLVVISLYISYRQRLGLEGELVTSAFRVVVQLYLVGLVLSFIFDINHPLLTATLIGLIIINAAFHAAKRGQGIDHVFWISLLAISFTVVGTLSLLVLAGALAFTPSQVIALGGTIAGNSMTALGLAYGHLLTTFDQDSQKIQERLALGANPKQASMGIIRQAMQKGMRPTLDKAYAVGIVTFPGTMNGLLFAGVEPKTAIMYQMMIMFTHISTATIASYVATHFAYQSFFDGRQRLKLSAHSRD